MTSDLPELLTGREVAALLRVSRMHVTRLGIPAAAGPQPGRLRYAVVADRGDRRYFAGDVRLMITGVAEPGGGESPSSAESEPKAAGLCTHSNQEG